MWRVAAIAACLAIGATPASASEDGCFAITGPDPDHVKYELVQGYSIERQTLPLTPPRTSGELQSITCIRSSLYLSANDIHVLTDLGVPMIVSNMADNRLLTFELTAGGTFRVRVDGGVLTPAEHRALGAAIAAMPFRISDETEL